MTQRHEPEFAKERESRLLTIRIRRSRMAGAAWRRKKEILEQLRAQRALRLHGRRAGTSSNVNYCNMRCLQSHALMQQHANLHDATKPTGIVRSDHLYWVYWRNNKPNTLSTPPTHQDSNKRALAAAVSGLACRLAQSRQADLFGRIPRDSFIY